MSENTVVHAGINNEINNEDIAVPVSMGLSMSDVIRIMLTHQVVFENTLPFDTMVPNSTTTAAMQDATDGKPESFDGIEELIEDLKTQDKTHYVIQARLQACKQGTISNCTRRNLAWSFTMLSQ